MKEGTSINKIIFQLIRIGAKLVDEDETFILLSSLTLLYGNDTIDLEEVIAAFFSNE